MKALSIAEVAKRLGHTNTRRLRSHLVRLDRMGAGILVGGGVRGAKYLVNWGRLRSKAPHLFDLPSEIDAVRRKVDRCVEGVEDLKGQNLAISNRLRALSVRLNKVEGKT